MSSSSNPDVPSSSVSGLTVDDGNGCGESVGVGVGVGGTDRPSVPTINGASKSASKSASRLSVSGVDVVVDDPGSSHTTPPSPITATTDVCVGSGSTVIGRPPRPGQPSVPSSSLSTTTTTITTPTTTPTVPGGPSPSTNASSTTSVTTATATVQVTRGSGAHPGTVTPISLTTSSSPSGGSYTGVNPLGRSLLNDEPYLIVLSKLGNGGYGDVYKASLFKKGKENGHVAVKVARLPDTTVTTDPLGAPLPPRHLHDLRHKARKLRRAQVEEAGALKSIPPHPHVLTALDVHDTRRWGLLIVLPLAPHGDVRAWLASGRRSWEERLCVVIGMALGLRHLHRLGLVHQDVKEGNVLMFEDCVARVSDFGLVRGLDGGHRVPGPLPEPSPLPSSSSSPSVPSSSVHAGAGVGAGAGSGCGTTTAPPPRHPPSTSSEPTPMSVSHTVSGAVTFAGGTPCYMSPEARRWERPTVLSDMWSFGLVSWAVLHGSGRVSRVVPWGVDDGSRVRGFVESSLRGLSGTGSTPGWLWDVVSIIGDCLVVDVKSRLSSLRAVSGLEDVWRRHRGDVSSSDLRGLVDSLLAAETGRSSSKDSRRTFEVARAGWLWGQKGRWTESAEMYESVVGWATGDRLVEAGCRLSSLYGGLGDEGRSAAAGVGALCAAGVGDRLGVWRQLAKESRSCASFRCLLGSDVGRADATGWSAMAVRRLLASLFENEDKGVCESVFGVVVSSVEAGVLAEAVESGWPLFLASWHGHVSVVRRLLGMEDVDVNRLVDSTGQTALWAAAKVGQLEVVEVLLVGGADVGLGDNKGYTALHATAGNGHLDVVEVLLSHEAEVNARLRNGATALWLGSQDGHLGVVEALLAAKADVNAPKTTDGSTPLHIASQNGHSGVVEALLAAKADVNAATTDDGVTPLYIASQNGHSGVVEALLAAKADVNTVKTTDGSTPLYMASQEGHLGVVEALLAAKADVNAPMTTDGSTPLYIASQRGHLGVVEALLAAKADVNTATTDAGATPLHSASQNGHLDIVKTLLHAGADPHRLSTSPSVTSLNVAVRMGHVDIATLLHTHRP